MTNKRAKAEELYAELRVEGYVPPEGKSLRGVFIDRAVMEFGMTEKGAATYYVNAKKRYEGGEVPNYYKAKTAKVQVGGTPTTIDTRWSVVKIENGKVSMCVPFATEEKARSEFKVLRAENKAMCMVVPGVMTVGEPTAHISEEEAPLSAAEPGDVEEE